MMALSTSQVAEILGLPEWRVKNYAEGEAYGLPPSALLGRGKGSRRLWTLADVFRIAVAQSLVNAGLTPEAVGEALKAVPQTVFTRYAEALESEEVPERETLLLVRTNNQGWAVCDKDADADLDHYALYFSIWAICLSALIKVALWMEKSALAETKATVSNLPRLKRKLEQLETFGSLLQKFEAALRKRSKRKGGK